MTIVTLAASVAVLGVIGPVVSAAASSEVARVYVYRYKQLAGATFEPPVFRDEVPVARIDNGRYFYVTLKPGTYVFRSSDAQAGVEVEAEAGQEYFVRVDMASGFLRDRGRLVIVPREQGLYEVQKLRKLDPEKLLPGGGASVGPAPFEKPPEGVVQRTGLLTNADILTLKGAGLGDELVIKKINSSVVRFSLEPSDLIDLKRSGVSERVLGAMLDAVK